MNYERSEGNLMQVKGKAKEQGDALMVNEKDAQAVSLGYTSDVAAQVCSNCSNYSGMAGGASGPCGIFSGKHVSAQGWCSAHAG